jgi:hypothetical protein
VPAAGGQDRHLHLNGSHVIKLAAGRALLLVGLLCLAACQRGAPIGAAAATENVTAAASTGAAGAATALVVGTAPLRVTILAPADEAVVSVPQVDVSGLAPAGSVITLNDTLVVVDASGQFSATLPLQEGPNQLDIVASDADGNQASTQLIVTYDPGG